MATGFTIAAVERDVGLSKDVLRVWERRYGFPAPARDANGERLYPADQVDRLRRIKRLMDQGHRPGRLLTLPPEELDALTSAGTPAAQDDGGDGLAALVGLVRRHEKDAFLQALQQRLAREGLQRFVQDTVAPLAGRIGADWEEGRLQVFEEHLFTELTGRVLQQAIASVPGGRAPRVLLTTVPNEQHAMGLLMVEAVLALEGATCISLGTQMPLLEIARAADAHRVDLVALSFSAAFPARQVAGLLHQLRALLPAQVGLWAGGRGVSRATGAEGIRVLHTLDEAVAAVAAWREEPA
ncbi:MerR family transcriptional regulator [Eleftheria terrae]|uniref:MerR family transcriptional regulator n=1 Tax=Eleftheria terrae TaxID=1597781 RepID=UPI00263AD8E6|nr:MerR family transcriptional regulator [Eleftheria terrae]WKB55827.1 MerR family transcriptional regulator [Eleftheria terrae]